MLSLLPIGLALTLGTIEAPESPDEFLASYRKQHERVVKVYRRLKATWIDRSRSLRDDPGTWTTSYLRWDDRERFIRSYAGGERAPLNRPFASFLSPDQLITIEERDDRKFFKRVREGDARRNWMGQFYLLGAYPAVGAYNMRWFGTPEMGYFEFLEARKKSLVCRRSSGDARLIEATVATFPNIPTMQATVRFQFDTSNAWVPKSIISLNPTGNRTGSSCELEYEGLHDGVPLVKRLRHHHLDPDDQWKKRSLYLDFEVTEITPLVDPPDDKEFQPEAAGALPYAAPIKERSYWWVWLLLGGLCLVTIAEYRRRRGRR